MTYTAIESNFWADNSLSEADQEWFEHIQAEQWALAHDRREDARSRRDNDAAEYRDSIAEGFEF